MKQVKLGEICDILNGYAFKSGKYVENGIRIIRITNVQKGFIEDIEPKYYDTSKINELKKYILDTDDLLISLTGNVGRVGLMTKDLLPAALNQRVGCLRIKDNKVINIRYLYQYLNSQKFEADCINNSNGIAQKNLSTEWLKEYTLLIPELNIQDKISKELDKVQEIIDIGKKQIKELDKLIQSKFVEMFGNIRNNVKLGDCCNVHARIGWQALTKSEHMKEGEYLLITGTDFKDNEIDYSSCVYVTKERYEMDKNIILKNNDILITKDGTIGKVAIVHNLMKPATLNGGVFVVRPDTRFNKEYITYVFKGPLFEEYVNKSKTGATIKHLNQKHLVEFEIPLPSNERQNEFSEIFKQINKHKNIAQKNLEDLQNLQESLMNKYFG